MKTIIAGGRDFDNWTLFLALMLGYKEPITMFISGGAWGADKMGERYARLKCKKPFIVNADWGKLGHSAGPIRNAKMAKLADALIAFWDGKSSGTKDMIDKANKRNLKVTIYRI